MIMPSPQSESDSISTFDTLPDALVLLIFDRIADVKTLGCCASVSPRLRSLSRQVHNAVIKVNRLISVDQPAKSSHVCGRIFKIPNLVLENHSADRTSKATQRSAAQMLENFNEIKQLRIELQSPELELDNASFLKWSASFGSTLNNFVVIAATSVLGPGCADTATIADGTTDSSVIPASFYTSGDLKSRIVCTISSLVAASVRHYSLHPIVTEHKTLENVTVNDVSKQGVLRMGKEQVEEPRKILPSISCSGNRTVVPDLEMRLWYAHRMDLGDGSVLVGATLGAIRPRGEVGPKKEFMEEDWVVGAFEEPFASAAKVMVKGRCYSVTIDSF